MCLSAPPLLAAEANSLADWVEFKVLISEFSSYRVSELSRISDGLQDDENPDITEQDAINESLVDLVLTELLKRSSCLEYSYPFYFNAEKSELLLKDPIMLGGYVYLYCLFFSHIHRDDVLIATPPSSNDDRDIMQICSTYAAAGVVDGNAVSFGFPRPDGSNFLYALKVTYAHMREGTVHETVPPGASRRVKDRGIDVVAWGNTPDHGPGKEYILGQVASGNNWKSKSVVSDIPPFHSVWFTRQPSSTPSPAMFIPFCITPERDSTYEQTLETLTFEFGRIFHRHRIPKYAEDGYWNAHANGSDNYVERLDEAYKIRDYVESFRDSVLSVSV